MAAWLVSALSLLRSGLGFGLRTARSPVALGAGGGFAASQLVDGGLSIPSFGFGGDRPRRRRRRRALTASDRADIAFISGTLGAKAGKDFAVTLVAGLTR